MRTEAYYQWEKIQELEAKKMKLIEELWLDGTSKVRIALRLRMSYRDVHNALAHAGTLARPAPMRMVVYFVRVGLFIKIGTTGDLPARIQAIETHCPYQVQLLGSCPGGLREEQALHRKFRRQRHRGEWFHATTGLLREIQRLCKRGGKFDDPHLQSRQSSRVCT